MTSELRRQKSQVNLPHFPCLLTNQPLGISPGQNRKFTTSLQAHQIIKATTHCNPFLMSSTSLLRIAARAQPSTFFRANGIRNITPRSSSAIYAIPALIATSGSASTFSTSSRMRSDAHEETFEEFTARYAAHQWLVPDLGDAGWALQCPRDDSLKATIVNC